MEKTIKVQIRDHLLLTVVRPNGVTEVVKHPTIKYVTENEFKTIQKMTKDAGRGDVISYENVMKDDVVRLTDADLVGMESDKMATMMAYGE